MKLLIVDDNNELRFVLEDFLNMFFDIEILKAANYHEAVDFILTENDLGVVVCDRQLMDHHDGIGVFKALNKYRLDVPFFLHTASRIEEITEFAGIEIAGYSHKNDLTSLIDNIREYLPAEARPDFKRSRFQVLTNYSRGSNL